MGHLTCMCCYYLLTSYSRQRCVLEVVDNVMRQQ